MLNNTRAISIVLTFSVMLLPALLRGDSAVLQADEHSLPKIVAHRGSSAAAPENTLAAFRLAWEENADAIEGDFRLTKDGQIVCIHDATTKRVGNMTLDVARSTLAQLRRLDVGSWKNAEFKAEKIPTLAEVLATIPEGKQLYLEIKSGPEILAPLKTELEKSKLSGEQILIISFDAEVIKQAREKLPEYRAFWISSYKKSKITGKLKPEPQEVLNTLKRINASGFDSQANLDRLTPQFLKELRARNLELHVWTVNEPALAKQLFDLPVTSLTTDRPALMLQTRTQHFHPVAETP